MRLIPPIIIKPAIIIITKPMIILYKSVPRILIFERASILNAPSRFATILLICPIFPMPNEAKIVNIAKSIARTFPKVLQFFLAPSPSRR